MRITNAGIRMHPSVIAIAMLCLTISSRTSTYSLTTNQLWKLLGVGGGSIIGLCMCMPHSNGKNGSEALHINIPLVFSEPISKLDSVCYLFCHGLRTSKRASCFFREYSRCTGPFVSFDFADQANNGLLLFKRKDAHFGQKKDVKYLLNACLQLKPILHQTNTPLVMWGQSRGAATIINALDLLVDKPAAIILESPYDELKTITAHLLHISRLGYPALIADWLSQGLFPGYDVNGQQPLLSVQSLRPSILNSIPTLIICSKQDRLVPWTSSQRIYRALKKTGHTTVHFVCLEHGDHGALLDGEDKVLYLNALHRFLKMYGLPYNDNFVTQNSEQCIKNIQ